MNSPIPNLRNCRSQQGFTVGSKRPISLRSLAAAIFTGLLTATAPIAGLAEEPDGQDSHGTGGETSLKASDERQGTGLLDENGEFCFECYSEEARQFKRLLEEFEAIQREYANVEAPSNRLERFDDFRVSRTGMLIHEGCFAPGRFNFDVEQAVVDGLVRAFSEFINLEEKAVEEWIGEPSAIARLHAPAFVSLYSSDQWQLSEYISYKYTSEDGSLLHSATRSESPCADLHPFASRYQIDLKNDCRFASHVERGRPKLFCQVGEVDASIKDTALRSLAYASNPEKPRPLVLNYQDRTSVYHEPYVVFNPIAAKVTGAAQFQSTLVHEHFHNFGWEDFSESHNSYPYFCQVAAFVDQPIYSALTSAYRNIAKRGCLSTKLIGGNEDAKLLAEKLERDRD